MIHFIGVLNRGYLLDVVSKSERELKLPSPAGSLPEPDFDCISENVLETWQKDNKTFKKTEYTMRLVVAGKTYFGSANTKKLAKTRVATEAWNIIRAGTF